MGASWCKFPKGVIEEKKVLRNGLALTLLVFLCDVCDHDPQEVDGVLVNRGQYLTTISFLKAKFTPEQKTLTRLKKAINLLKTIGYLTTKGVFIVNQSNEPIKRTNQKEEKRTNQKGENRTNQKTLLTLLFIDDCGLEESEKRTNQTSEKRTNQTSEKRTIKVNYQSEPQERDYNIKETKLKDSKSTPTPKEENEETVSNASDGEKGKEEFFKVLQNVSDYWNKKRTETGSKFEPVDLSLERCFYSVSCSVRTFGEGSVLRAIDKIFGESRPFLEETNSYGRPFDLSWLFSKVPEILSGKYDSRPRQQKRVESGTMSEEEKRVEWLKKVFGE